MRPDHEQLMLGDPHRQTYPGGSWVSPHCAARRVRLTFREQNAPNKLNAEAVDSGRQHLHLGERRPRADHPPLADASNA
jgi:hypothetical protein